VEAVSRVLRAYALVDTEVKTRGYLVSVFRTGDDTDEAYNHGDGTQFLGTARIGEDVWHVFVWPRPELAGEAQQWTRVPAPRNRRPAASRP
jgi:hypothetical protein